jgi:hypothetical protein
MKLSASEDIEAPLDRVFAEISDFGAIERQALRRGAEVRRTDTLSAPGAGLKWHAAFRFRGKPREADIVMTEYTPPDRMVFHCVTGGLHTHTVIDLVALSRSRTRIALHSTLDPKTLSARLLVQSLKLAKGGIDKRFRKRMASFAKHFEDRLKRSA